MCVCSFYVVFCLYASTEIRTGTSNEFDELAWPIWLLAGLKKTEGKVLQPAWSEQETDVKIDYTRETRPLILADKSAPTSSVWRKENEIVLRVEARLNRDSFGSWWGRWTCPKHICEHGSSKAICFQFFNFFLNKNENLWKSKLEIYEIRD